MMKPMKLLTAARSVWGSDRGSAGCGSGRRRDWQSNRSGSRRRRVIGSRIAQGTQGRGAAVYSVWSLGYTAIQQPPCSLWFKKKQLVTPCVLEENCGCLHSKWCVVHM